MAAGAVALRLQVTTAASVSHTHTNVHIYMCAHTHTHTHAGAGSDSSQDEWWHKDIKANMTKHRLLTVTELQPQQWSYLRATSMADQKKGFAKAPEHNNSTEQQEMWRLALNMQDPDGAFYGILLARPQACN